MTTPKRNDKTAALRKACPLSQAFAAVLRARFELAPDEVKGEKRGLGYIISGVEPHDPDDPQEGDEAKKNLASIRGAQLLHGRCPIPEFTFDAIADYVGLTSSELLRAWAAELEARRAEHPGRFRNPRPRSAGPR